MESSNLEEILSGTASTPAPPEPGQPAQTTEPPVAAQPEPEDDEDEAKGEVAGTPPAPKEDHLERARKGLEAAVKAERDKRQAAEQREQQVKAELQAERERWQRPASDADAPKREQFQSDDAYFRAVGRYEAKQEQQAEQARQAEEREVRERLERETVLAVRTRDVVAQAMTHQGFDFTAFAQTPITEPMMEAILESDSGGAVVHHLVANQTEATRIAKLSPAAQVRQIVQLEAKLKEAPSAAAPAPAAAPAVALPKTLTNERDQRGRFAPAYQGPTPLNVILESR